MAVTLSIHSSPCSSLPLLMSMCRTKGDYVVKIFMLIYFCRPSTLRKLFNMKIFPTKISYNENFLIYGITFYLDSHGFIQERGGGCAQGFLSQKSENYNCLNTYSRIQHSTKVQHKCRLNVLLLNLMIKYLQNFYKTLAGTLTCYMCMRPLHFPSSPLSRKILYEILKVHLSVQKFARTESMPLVECHEIAVPKIVMQHS